MWVDEARNAGGDAQSVQRRRALLLEKGDDGEDGVEEGRIEGAGERISQRSDDPVSKMTCMLWGRRTPQERNE
jgi:hypothetical protein